MPRTTYYAHTGTGRVRVGRLDAAYLSRRHGVRITAVTEGADG